jgi:hypothetical protein
MNERLERVGFRFFRLTKLQADEVIQLYPGAKIRPTRKEEEHYVVSLWLQENERYEDLVKFVAEAGLQEEEYGLFVSVRTDFDTGIVRAPQFALRLSRRVGGVVDFSYTVTG